MANDPNIILQGQQQDPSNTINAFLMGRKLAQENREYENQNRLAEILQNTPREKLADTLYQQGMFKEGQDYEKNQADISKTNAETGIKQFEHHKNMLDNTLNLISSMEDNPMLNKAMMLSGLETSKAQGLIDDTVYVPALKELEALPDDTIALRQFSKQKKTQLLGVKENMKYQMPTANAQLQAQTSQANAQLGADTSRQNAMLSAETQRGGQQFNYDLGMQRLENDRQKSALTGLKQPAGVITPQQKINDANDVLKILDQAEPLLKSSTHSLIGAGIDAGAAAFGKSTTGAQAAAQLKALEGALISKMPKMSGPQSDKDVLLYKQMAGQIGDSTLPIETRKAAMDTIRALNERYAGASGAGHGASDSWGGVDYKQKHGATEEEHAEVMRLLGR